MSKILEHLMKPSTTVVFDVDGVLAAYEFGELNHCGCQDEYWEDFCKGNNPYDKAKPIPQIEKFIKAKGRNHIYVCSVAKDYERINKTAFCMREYGISRDHIFFVDNASEKQAVLEKIEEMEGKKQINIALVEDTVTTLNQLYTETDFCTVHVSSFFFFDKKEKEH